MIRRKFYQLITTFSEFTCRYPKWPLELNQASTSQFWGWDLTKGLSDWKACSLLLYPTEQKFGGRRVQSVVELISRESEMSFILTKSKGKGYHCFRSFVFNFEGKRKNIKEKKWEQYKIARATSFTCLRNSSSFLSWCFWQSGEGNLDSFSITN